MGAQPLPVVGWPLPPSLRPCGGTGRLKGIVSSAKAAPCRARVPRHPGCVDPWLSTHLSPCLPAHRPAKDPSALGCGL